MKELKIYGVKGLDQIEEHLELPHISLSFYDLNQIVGFKSAKETNNTKELERILFECGLNTNSLYVLRKCIHRPRSSNIPYEGFRFEGTERTDKPYLMSGLASLEAKVFTTDKELRKDLNDLDPHKMHKRSFDEDARAHIDTFKDDAVYKVEVEDLVVSEDVEETEV